MIDIFRVEPPNTSFQRTRVRGGRGFGQLNSDRYRPPMLAGVMSK